LAEQVAATRKIVADQQQRELELQEKLRDIEARE
jgi:hypothetical protein